VAVAASRWAVSDTKPGNLFNQATVSRSVGDVAAVHVCKIFVHIFCLYFVVISSFSPFKSNMRLSTKTQRLTNSSTEWHYMMPTKPLEH
jgi:hypothetical protein